MQWKVQKNVLQSYILTYGDIRFINFLQFDIQWKYNYNILQ